MSEEKKKIVVPLDEEPVEVAPAEPEHDFSAWLVPGAELGNSAGAFEPGRAQGTGKCHGVIYLLGRKDPKTSAYIPGLEDRFKEALRYLKPQSMEWRALNPDRVGRCVPQKIWAILNQPQNRKLGREIQKLCVETRQGFAWSFHSCERAIEATIPKNVHHWHVVKTPSEGVWAVIWVS